MCITDPLAPSSQVILAKKQSRHMQRGPLSFSLYARETACSSTGSWQLWGLPATGCCFAIQKEKLWQK